MLVNSSAHAAQLTMSLRCHLAFMIATQLAPEARNHVDCPGLQRQQNPAHRKNGRPQHVQDKAADKGTQLCFHYIRGTCTQGEKCTFTHDIDAYIAQRPPDLPGQCPFSGLQQCPQGLRCRWATTHAHPDDMTRSQAHRLQRMGGSEAQPAGHYEDGAAHTGWSSPFPIGWWSSCAIVSNAMYVAHARSAHRLTLSCVGALLQACTCCHCLDGATALTCMFRAGVWHRS